MDDPGIIGLFDESQEGDDKDTIPKNINLEEFLKENYNDTISVLKQSNYKTCWKPFLVMFHHLKMNGVKYWIDKLHEVALKFQNSIHFMVAELEDSTLFHCNRNEWDYYGFNSDTEPFVYGVDIDGRQHQFEESFKIDELIRYCEKLARNEIYQSERMPIYENPERNVRSIVADTFKELVEENEKDVHLTIYSNRSLRCVEDVLRKLCEKLKEDRDTIIFYKINASTNYIPLRYKAPEFPRSYFIPKNYKSKPPLRFNCNETEDRKLIAKHASNVLKTVDKLGNFKNIAQIEKDFYDEEKHRNVIDVLEKLTAAVERKLPSEDKDNETGFHMYLGSILSKSKNEIECDSIKAEIISLASKRVTEVLIAKARKNRK